MSERRSAKSILILCVILCLTASANSCWLVRPSVEMPVYDVLKPGVEVDILAIYEDGTVLVTTEFMTWVKMLTQEIERLRDKVGEDW